MSAHSYSLTGHAFVNRESADKIGVEEFTNALGEHGMGIVSAAVSYSIFFFFFTIEKKRD